MWELEHKEGWVTKNWCFWTVVLEKTLENLLDSKMKPVNPKGNQPWTFIGRTGAEAKVPILWPPDAQSQQIGKDPDAGKDWGQEEKGMTDEMFGFHHWLKEHRFEKTPEDSEGQGNLACYSLWGCKSQTWLSNWLTTNINNMGAAKNSNGGQVCATFHCICAEILLCMKAIRVCVCVCVYSKIILVSER